MLTIIAILVILWFFGFITTHAFGGLIYLLAATAAILFISRLIRGRTAF